MTTEIVMDHTGDKPAFVNLPSSKEAAQTSPERRWNNDLLERFRLTPMYATILEEHDADLQRAATKAEVKRTGAGVRCILEGLLRRRVLSQIPSWRLPWAGVVKSLRSFTCGPVGLIRTQRFQFF
jgi:hypothetical protein